MNENPRHVVVTGAGSGIGLACATRFAQAGWAVTFNVFDQANELAARERVASFDSPTQALCLVLKGDVSVDQQCRAMADQALAKFGRIDALVNAAGITRFCDESNLEGINAADFQAIYAVNTIGTFQMARACAVSLKASAQGTRTSSIVNLSSYAGIHGGGSSLALVRRKRR